MLILSPNKPDAANPAIASQFQTGCQWRGVADPGRSARSGAVRTLELTERGFVVVPSFRSLRSLRSCHFVFAAENAESTESFGI